MDGIARNSEGEINRLLATSPAAAVLGVRQCGKSTLSRMVGKDWKYYDLEHSAHFEIINSAPQLFLRDNSDKIIIDEAQLSSKLFKALRVVIDQGRNRNGRSIITGSASFELLKNISETRAS